MIVKSRPMLNGKKEIELTKKYGHYNVDDLPTTVEDNFWLPLNVQLFITLNDSIMRTKSLSDISPPPAYPLFLIANKQFFMKKIILLSITIFTFYTEADCQITKTNWMVGGNASFSYTNSNTTGIGDKVTVITIAPDIGYFLFDKFVTGVRLSYIRNHVKFVGQAGSFTKASNLIFGPFVRYYLLPVDQRFNIISEGSYQFGNEVETNESYRNNVSTNSFTFSGGPVIYFNNSVGLEFLFSYTSRGDSRNANRSNTFRGGIGFQIYLQKDKN